MEPRLNNHSKALDLMHQKKTIGSQQQNKQRKIKINYQKV